MAQQLQEACSGGSLPLKRRCGDRGIQAVKLLNDIDRPPGEQSRESLFSIRPKLPDPQRTSDKASFTDFFHFTLGA